MILAESTTLHSGATLNIKQNIFFLSLATMPKIKRYWHGHSFTCVHACTCVCVCVSVWVQTVCFSTCACVRVGIGRNHWGFPSVFRHHTVSVCTTILQVIYYRWLSSLQGPCLGEGPQCVPPPGALVLRLGCAPCPDGRERVLPLIVCIHPYAHKTHTHPMSLLSSRFPALLCTMLGPHFVFTSTYPPSVVSRLAQVCTVGLLSIQGVSLDRIICCSVYRQMYLMLHSYANLKTDCSTLIAVRYLRTHLQSFLTVFLCHYIQHSHSVSPWFGSNIMI